MFANCKVNAMGVCSNAYHENKGQRGQADFRMSPSALKTFMASPSKWMRGYNPPDSEAKKWGSFLDTRLLTPKRFEAGYALRPDTYESKVMECPVCHSQSDSKKCAKCKSDRVETTVTKDWNNNSNTCSAWMDALAGKEAVTKLEVSECDAAIDRLLAGDEIIRAWHDACDTQVHITGEWHDKATGLIIPVECLLDYVPRLDTEFASSLGDLKTTTNAALRPFAKWVWTAGYHIQAAFDTDIFNAATGEARDSWVFILSENYPPYEPGRRLLSQNYMDMGRAFYRNALARYARCLKTDTWPGYDDNADAVQGWSIIEPEPWMNFEAVSEAMESAQAEAETRQETDDIIP